MKPPSWALRCLYIGTADFDRDLAYYRDVLAARLVWHFEHFGAKVAAASMGDGPLLLLADYRPAPSCMPVFEGREVRRKGPRWLVANIASRPSAVLSRLAR